MGLLLICCSGQGPHLVMTGEPRGFSRVAAGFSCQALFFGAPKSLQMETAAMKLKDAYSLDTFLAHLLFCYLVITTVRQGHHHRVPAWLMDQESFLTAFALTSLGLLFTQQLSGLLKM